MAFIIHYRWLIVFIIMAVWIIIWWRQVKSSYIKALFKEQEKQWRESEWHLSSHSLKAK